MNKRFINLSLADLRVVSDYLKELADLYEEQRNEKMSVRYFELYTEVQVEIDKRIEFIFPEIKFG